MTTLSSRPEIFPIGMILVSGDPDHHHTSALSDPAIRHNGMPTSRGLKGRTTNYRQVKTFPAFLCLRDMAEILIIGASSGIGNALATVLMERGDGVIGTKNKSEATSFGWPMFTLNVLDHSPDLSFIPDVIDGLVYCPGTINLKPFPRFSADDFSRDFAIQTGGFVKVLQKALPALKRGTNPSVVTFSTAAVTTGFPFHSVVSASKGAMEGLTRALAAEFAPSIRFNCIAPSITDTPLAAPFLGTGEKRAASAQRHPLKKFGTPADIAELAAFLLSDKSAWITGQVIHADGGITTLKV